MSTSAISSSPSRRRRAARVLPGARGRALALAAALGLFLVGGGEARAQEVISQDEALRLAFPGATRIERRTAFLDEAELATARRLAGKGVEVKQGVLTYYVGSRGSEVLGAAYFDAHRVRTLSEVVMVVVTPHAAIDRIEVLRFAEPPEYRAPRGWLDQFGGRQLTPDLAPSRGVVNMTGATLTSHAIAGAARRVLALHRVIGPFALPVAAR